MADETASVPRGHANDPPCAYCGMGPVNYRPQVRKLEQQREKAKKQLAAAMTALEWYGERARYSLLLDSQILRDRGQIARDAIAEVERLGRKSHEMAQT